MGERAWHRVQTTSWAVPWSSTTLRAESPASWCSPSMFCVRTRTAVPDRSRSATARWAAFGRAFNAAAARRICQERRRISGSAM